MGAGEVPYAAMLLVVARFHHSLFGNINCFRGLVKHSSSIFGLEGLYRVAR
mgnify:CR=1 FL=1